MFYNINLLFCEILLSLPSRERGLKLTVRCNYRGRCYVAPFAGAWIEIKYTDDTKANEVSLPSRERGLKYEVQANNPQPVGRSLRGSVD